MVSDPLRVVVLAGLMVGACASYEEVRECPDGRSVTKTHFFASRATVYPKLGLHLVPPADLFDGFSPELEPSRLVELLAVDAVQPSTTYEVEGSAGRLYIGQVDSRSGSAVYTSWRLRLRPTSLAFNEFFTPEVVECVGANASSLEEIGVMNADHSRPLYFVWIDDQRVTLIDWPRAAPGLPALPWPERSSRDG